MPAYNPPQQVLFSPVTNYYQGKAIRLQQEMQQKELDSYDKKMELEERRVAATEQNAQTNADILSQRVTEYEYRVGEEVSKRNAWDIYHGVRDINSRVQSGDTSEGEALQEAKSFLTDYADSLPEGAKEEADAIRSAIEDRDGLTIEEWQEIGRTAEAGAGYYGFIDRKDPVVLADGAELYDASGRRIARNPKDFAPNTGVDRPTYDPPNSSEIEAAESLIDNDPLLDDLETRDEKNIAVMALANDIRQLQEDFGISYIEAAKVALDQLKRRISLEKDFFSGKDSKLDIDDGGLADNEYLGKDGNVYIEEPDGGFRRKN
jgi:ribosomal protein L7/L12